ncbi:MAG: ATP-dependent sacrificial sulfur transferase LarE [candidate division WOR-3 bacterium]
MRIELERLKKILKRYPGAIIAFSGGVDSTLLLKIARLVLKDKVIAVTAKSPLYPESEIKNACSIARRLQVCHIIIETDELKNPEFIKNSQSRCFHCKMELFKRLKEIGAKYGYVVLEGSNYSDLKDFRPGLVAARRLGVLSPLIEARIKKEKIREIAKRLRLPNWNKPSMACLASRIPYGQKIDKKILQRIEEAEKFLMRMHFRQCRVRDHFPIARIEIPTSDFGKMLRNCKKVVKFFKKLGYKYITLDLEGYRTGSMNL